MARLIVLALALVGSAAGIGQAPAMKPPPATGSDVVVKGLPPGPYPVEAKTSTSQFAIESKIVRQATSDARLFTRCIKPADAMALRRAIDGLPNRNERAAGLDQMVRDHQACYPGFASISTFAGHYYGYCNPRGEFMPIYDPRTHMLIGATPRRTVCQAFYDRGALVEKALALYAPDLAFTTKQLLDPSVVARLHAREDRFNRTRGNAEQLYVRVTDCLVAYHPDLALAYLHSAATSNAEAKLQRALIGTSPQCLAGAKTVSADPSEFRVFMADAIYSWAVALRDEDSLVPLTVH